MKSIFRTTINLNGFWKFKLDKNNIGEKEKWYNGLEDYKPIYVPSSWNEQNPEWDQYSGIAWYEREFYVQSEFRNKLIWLIFKGSGYYTKVWINGSIIGEHEGQYTAFRFDITKKIKFAGINKLVVKVDNRLSLNRIPAAIGTNATSYDFFPYGGIHRDVYIEYTEPEYIKDLTIITNHNGKLDITILTSINECNLRIRVVDREELINELIKCKNGKGIFNKFVKGIKPWSPKSPKLYSVFIDLLYNKEIKDSVYERIGFRDVKVRDGVIYLNDKPIYLKGFGRHEDFPVTGKYLPGSVLIRDFYLMKKIGANSFRTSHYPYSDEHLDLADEFGFLVILETPLCYSGVERITDKVKEMFSSKEFMEKAKKVINEIIKQHRNRPSVIMYSVMNEPPSNIEEVAIAIKELGNYIRSKDKTRPITFASRENIKDKGFGFVDIISLNLYMGWYSDFGNIEEGIKKAKEIVKEIHEKYPDKPIIITEFGSAALSGIHSDPPQMWSEEYQAEFLDKYIKELSSYVQGLHIWNFADFRATQSFYRTILNRKGVFTRDRQPKLAVKIVKNLFSKLQ